MVLRVAFSGVAGAVAAALTGERGLSEYSYDAYIMEFEKLNRDELRREVFEANLLWIKAHNAMASKSWFATVNKFTDMSHDQFQSMWVLLGIQCVTDL